ncbi:MAG: hypothetical protein EPN56_08150 [Rhodanobacter sp.]|nr:MAG: hypothetical protein EPN78_07710 [Rhodanobacter sp.]TAM11042.1 MAG: hypothetical protein EPN66_08620 [Rhodanobacter sp.]TAM35559.1 MAG: hypothetical protein EPN56_08150 [Rhodanobacter sp.]
MVRRFSRSCARRSTCCRSRTVNTWNRAARALCGAMAHWVVRTRKSCTTARRHLTLSPDLQWIRHPGYDRARGPAAFAGLRTHVKF